MTPLKAPFAYKGSKKRFADQIVPYLLATGAAEFLDVFSGSGAVTWALINAGIEPSRITMIEGSIFGALWAALADGSFDLDRFVREGGAIPDHGERGISYMRERTAQVTDLSEALSLLPYVQSLNSAGMQVRLDNGFKDFYPRPWNPIKQGAFAPVPREVMSRIRTIAAKLKGAFVLAQPVTPSGLRSALNGLGGSAVAYLDPPYGKQGKDYKLGFLWRELLSEPVRHPVFVSEYESFGHSIELAKHNGKVSGFQSKVSGERLNYFAPGSTV